MRLQKLVVMMALVGALGSANVSALGLGEVKLYSSLNQPLVAEIELLQVKDLTRTEILPNLASRSDFERAGVQRPFGLTDLNFKTVIDESGKRVIKVTSSKPIQEPFLNFLLEVHWPSGRLLREYTVLLDPPAFSDQPVAPVKAPESSYGTMPAQEEVPAGQGYLLSPVPEPPTSYTRSEPQQVRKLSPKKSSVQPSRSSYSSSGSADRYTVRNNDTLWEIAQKVRPDNQVSIQQTMLAIQRSNSRAFMNGNINRLKQGEVLRIPDLEEIEALTVREAISDVARQNKEWQGKSRVAQIDATRRSSVKPTSAAPVGDGKLAIVGSDTQAGQGQDLGGGKSASNGALQTELAMTRERLDKLTRENTELTSRLQDLDDQVATLKRLLTLKDDQMAALQSEMNNVQAEPPVPVKPAVVAKPAAQPVPEPGFMDFLFGNPLILALLGLLPLGLLGFLLYRRRRQQQDLVMDDEEFVTSLDLGGNSEPDSKFDDELNFDESLEIDESLLDEVADEPTSQETEDALSEADIYIAYGRFNQAADLLTQAISEEPQRSDLRLKLLEVHAENNDLDGFREALSGLEATADVEAIGKAEIFKTRFPSDAFEDGASLVTDDLDDLDLDLGLDDELEVDNIVEDEPGLNDLEFDLDDLDVQEEVTEPEKPAEPEADDDALDFNIDDLDLDISTDLTDGSELPEIDLDDLDIDFDEPEAEAPTHSVAEDTEAAFSEDGGSSLEAAINDDDLDFLSDDDEVATKLDLARAYMDMGDMDGAKDILEEVLEQGSEEQKAEANGLIGKM